MQKIKKAAAILALGGAMALAYSSMAMAAVPDSINQGVDASKPTGASECLFNTPGCSNSIFQSVADTLIFIVGAVSVIMLIIGGLRYVLSSGNSSAVEGAKNTILYAIIGIVVAVLAFAAVHFVIAQLNK